MPLLLAALPSPQSELGDPLQAERLAVDVEFLADDVLQGRASASWGGHAAARFLATRFQQIGLQPVGDDWLHAFSVKPLMLDLDATYLQLEDHRFSAGRAFIPHPSAPEGKASGPLVFAGFGMSAKELDVKGAIVLIERYEAGAQMGRPLAMRARLRNKVQHLQEQGALAVLVADSPQSPDLPQLPNLPRDPIADGASYWPSLSPLQRILEFELTKPEVRKKYTEMNLTQSEAVALLFLEMQNHAPLGVTIPVAYVSRSVAEQLHPWKMVSLQVKHRWQTQSTAFNVVGMLTGKDPLLAEQLVVIAAHYDHLGMNDAGAIWNGADDNASGVAALLGLAEFFMMEEHRPQRSMVFVAFSGEESGLLGAFAFLKQRTVAVEDIVLMMNFEMIGRLEEQQFGLIGSRSAEGLEDLVHALPLPLPWSMHENHEVFFDRSDQAPFHQIGVPTLLFTGGEHEDYHRSSDTAEKIDYAGMEVIVRFAAELLHEVDRQKKKLTPRDYLNMQSIIFGEAPKQRGLSPLPFHQYLDY